MRSEPSRRLNENPSSPVQGGPSRAMERLAGPRPAARHPRTHSALLLSLLLLLSACAGMQPQSERTKVTLSDIHPLASTLVEQRYLVKLRLQNRSRQPLEINGASFDLDLNGKAFASGVSNQAVTVEPFGEALLEIKVSGSLFGVIRQVQSLQKLEDKPFQYRISGSLSRPNSLFNLPFNESGEIDLRLPVNPY